VPRADLWHDPAVLGSLPWPRRVVALAFSGAALASLVVALQSLLPSLGRLQDRYESLSPAAAEATAARHVSLDDRALVFFRTNVRDADRFFFQRPDDPALDPLNAATGYAQYRLVPARLVTDPANATVVVSYGADPVRLGLVYSSIVRLPGRPGFSVARVRR